MPDSDQPGGYIEELPSGVRRIESVDTSLTCFVGRTVSGAVNIPTRIDGYADFMRDFGGLHDDFPLSYALRDYFRNGGTRAVVLRLQPQAGDLLTDTDYMGDAAANTGIYALNSIDFNLLCIPPDTREGDTSAAVYAAAAAYCQQRRALLIIDPPLHWGESNAAQIVVQTKALARQLGAADHALLYFPRLLQPDARAGDALYPVAACGAIAGVMARTDTQQGVWKAAAGSDAYLKGFGGLHVELGDAQLGVLNEAGVVCLRRIEQSAFVIWGARTLAGTGEFKYVPVRRLALFIEASLYRGLQWVVFEPNDEPLWAAVHRSVEDFMLILFRSGALQGTTPREAYFVRCGRDTMTQADIDAGNVKVLVGFAPLRPAEFVLLRFSFRTADDDDL